MAKVRRTLGTGITKRAEIAFDQSLPNDLQLQIDAAVRTAMRASFQHLSAQIIEDAERILTASGLPTDPRKEYQPSLDTAFVMLPDLVELLGHQPDSPEGYAARLLVLIDLAQRQASTATPDEAMATAFVIGELLHEAQFKEVWEPDALRGEKVVAGAKAGHETVHGSAAAKSAARLRYVRAFEHEQAQGLSKMDAYRVVAKQFGVDVRTVRRAINAAHRK